MMETPTPNADTKGNCPDFLRLIEDRVPAAGKIAVWITDAAWATATFFVIPVIALAVGARGAHSNDRHPSSRLDGATAPPEQSRSRR
jgi:hypothetical protein